MSRDPLYLRHILDAIDRIEAYASVGHDEFIAKSHWHDAAIRQLEIIGEAAKQLTPGLRARHDDVPWRRICGLRDVLIHNYMGVDLEAVWQIVEANLPSPKERVSQILAGETER